MARGPRRDPQDISVEGARPLPDRGRASHLLVQRSPHPPLQDSVQVPGSLTAGLSFPLQETPTPTCQATLRPDHSPLASPAQCSSASTGPAGAAQQPGPSLGTWGRGNLHLPPLRGSWPWITCELIFGPEKPS